METRLHVVSEVGLCEVEAVELVAAPAFGWEQQSYTAGLASWAALAGWACTVGLTLGLGLHGRCPSLADPYKGRVAGGRSSSCR